MTEPFTPIEIPDRALFKAAEVCDLAKLQPYVLRSWEVEFKDLGVQRSGSSTRVYRRTDVERVLKIKHLLLIEGLTLAGVRRKLEEEAEPPLELEALTLVSSSEKAADDATRECIGRIKSGLASLLELLDGDAPGGNGGHQTGGSADFSLASAERAPEAKPSKRRVSAAAEKGSSPRSKRSS